MTAEVSPPVEDQLTATQRAKQEAHNDRIVATFNSVMLADGLKVLKHHRRSSKKAASRVIRFVPDYGGALVWDKPLRQPGAKASRVPLDAITQVELEARIVWISAGDERVGFETSKTEDADLMYQAICILVDSLVAHRADPDVISACASQCRDISALGPHGGPPLHVATVHGHVDAMIVLIQLGARVDATDDRRTVALRVAMESDRLEAFRLLVNAGANVDAHDGSGVTVLHTACFDASWNVLRHTMAEILIEAGANVHAIDKDRNTPTMMAANNPRLLKQILYRGSKPPLDIAHRYATYFQGSKRMDVLLRILVEQEWAPPPPESNADRHSGDRTSNDTVSSEGKESGPTSGDSDDDGDGDECGHGQNFLLHAAVSEDDVEILQALLERGEDPNVLDYAGMSPLAVAAFDGRISMVEALLGAGAWLDLKDARDGYTPLHMAAAAGHIEVTGLLLAAAVSDNSKITDTGSFARDISPCSGKAECGASASSSFAAAATKTTEARPLPGVVDAMSYNGRRPLHLAATRNHVQVVEVLLGAGADVDCRDKRGGTPLFYAAKEDNAESVIALLKAGASPDIKNSSGYAALHMAVQRPAAAVMKALIAAGASPGVGGERGITPLHVACEWNARGTVEALLRAGAVPGHCWNDYLESPLLLACRCGSLNAVKVLLPHLSSRQINMRNRTIDVHEGGETPLVAAIWYEYLDEWEKIEAVEELLGAGADPTLRTSADMDPLSAVILGFFTKTNPALGPPMIRALVAAGADVNGVRSPRGFAPLHLACYEGACAEVVEALLDAGADPCMPCAGSMQEAGMPFMTPLQLAGAGGNVEAVSVLIGHPACGGLNAVGDLPSRATALACAVQHGETEVCRFLLELGADMDLLPYSSKRHAGDGSTPVAASLIEMAARLGHLDAMKLLIQAKMLKDQAEQTRERAVTVAAGNGGWRLCDV
eukprot:g4779.t1